MGKNQGKRAVVLLIYYGGGQRIMFFDLVLFHPFKRDCEYDTHASVQMYIGFTGPMGHYNIKRNTVEWSL